MSSLSRPLCNRVLTEVLQTRCLIQSGGRNLYFYIIYRIKTDFWRNKPWSWSRPSVQGTRGWPMTQRGVRCGEGSLIKSKLVFTEVQTEPMPRRFECATLSTRKTKRCFPPPPPALRERRERRDHARRPLTAQGRRGGRAPRWCHRDAFRTPGLHAFAFPTDRSQTGPRGAPGCARHLLDVAVLLSPAASPASRARRGRRAVGGLSPFKPRCEPLSSRLEWVAGASARP